MASFSLNLSSVITSIKLKLLLLKVFVDKVDKLENAKTFILSKFKSSILKLIFLSLIFFSSLIEK